VGRNRGKFSGWIGSSWQGIASACPPGTSRTRPSNSQPTLLQIIAVVRQLDDLLVQLADNVNTDIMPGPKDPATMVLHQQPLYRVMFPQAGLFPTLQFVTIPYGMEVAGRNFIVVSG